MKKNTKIALNLSKKKCKITVNEIKFEKYIFFLIKNYAFSSKKIVIIII